jgi:tetratricopeptide (TPR) repeat protein/tRNA A-37 threonylcarbamoyl transferase component Bud32
MMIGSQEREMSAPMFMDNRFFEELSRPDLAQLQDVVEHFEAAWRSGQEPAIDDYLPEDSALRLALLVELVHADLEWRLRCGLPASVGSYLQAYPELKEDSDTILDLLGLEQALRSPSPGLLPGSGRDHLPSLERDQSSPAPAGASAANGCLSRRASPRMGRFEILDLLGSGAFATVYKARDTRLKRCVALKVLRHSALVTPVERERFLHEARSAAQVCHPHIVAIHDAGEFEGVCYLVSELIDGVTLAERLKAGPLSPRQAADLAAAVAETLHYAHQRGVIHRDIKPSNILIDTADHPHVTDFGLAKREGGESTLAQEGDLIGTPAYMSPEQARGEAHRVDARSDVYSLGAVLYQMLTGEAPFRGNVRMLLAQVVDEEPRSLRRLNDQVPRDLENICLKAMAKEPRARYATAGALAEDLHAFLAARPVQARPIGPMSRFARWCRRKPILTGLAAALIVVVVSGATAATWQWRRAERHLVEAETQRERADQQRASAEQSFALAHQLVGDLAELRDHPALRRTYGTEPLRAELARKVADYYEDFVKQRGSDPTLRHQVAGAYRQIGHYYQLELGTSEKGTEALEKAAVVYEKLIAEHPDVPTYRREQIEIYVTLIPRLRLKGHMDRARHFIDLAANRLDALSVEDADSSTDRIVAQNHHLLGEYYREAGALDKARAEHEKACANWQELYGRTADFTYLRLLASDRAMLARAWDELGNSHMALRWSQDATKLMLELLERFPLDQEYQEFLATRYHVTGNIYSDLNQLEEAVRSYRQALPIREKLAQANPNNADRWSNISGTSAGLGEVLEQLDRHDEALAAFQEAVANLKIYLTKTPMTLKQRRRLSTCHHCVARIERKLGRHREAEAVLLECKALWPNVPAALYHIAWELGQCATSGLERHKPFTREQEAERKHCAGLAMQVLREALACSFGRMWP